MINARSIKMMKLLASKKLQEEEEELDSEFTEETDASCGGGEFDGTGSEVLLNEK
jgi:hypothetical protein